MPHSKRKNQVAVIGAGVSGLTTARRLTVEGLHVTVYERHPDSSGVWHYNKNPNEKKNKSTIPTPMYDNLNANFPRILMEFADHPWPANESLFPTREKMLEYLRRYGEGLPIKYNREVIDIYRLTRHPNHGGKRWKVKTRDARSKDNVSERNFDAVVVATGTFDCEWEPEYPGLKEWRRMYPRSVSHSKTFNKADKFHNKRVLLIGNSAAGWEISKQITQVASKVWVSSSRPNSLRSVPSIEAIRSIKALNPQDRTVEIEVTDNQSQASPGLLKDVDKIITCTGYQYTLPYIRKGLRAQEPLWSDSFYVVDLYLSTFWIEDPTLSFIGLPKQGPTFLISQAQAAVVARYLANVFKLPSATDMYKSLYRDRQEWATRRAENPGQDNEKTFHNLPYPRCRDYIKELERISDMEWHNANVRDVRAAFDSQGDRKYKFSTAESLDFKRS
ncbi:FAD/NAD(P)-binding domain-containing protein [Xylariaceae sp. FL0255]|nr:FAD/NAD(P)-binding domain-containing protein [Xylariaceae sp. FL0255]